MVLIVVSPARSFDYESPLATGKYSEPALLERSAELVDIMATKSPAELSKMLGVSQALAATSFERFHDWELPFTPDHARPALLAFRGDA
ncbi:MAG: peroxide stress protein YaaA, partial [Actinomycetia bacterium]|nr:peroxide stress protein YaaA [Actinomycetes bacterium]